MLCLEGVKLMNPEFNLVRGGYGSMPTAPTGPNSSITAQNTKTQITDAKIGEVVASALSSKGEDKKAAYGLGSRIGPSKEQLQIIESRKAQKSR